LAQARAIEFRSGGLRSGALCARGDEPPLSEAARNRQRATVQLLLDSGAPIDAVNYRGETALMLAASWGHRAVVQILLKARANVHLMGLSGDALAYAAANQRDLGVARDLLVAGCRPDEKNSKGNDTLDELIKAIPPEGKLSALEKRALAFLHFLDPYLSPGDRARIAPTLNRAGKAVNASEVAAQKLEKKYHDLGAAKAVAHTDWAKKVQKSLGDIRKENVRKGLELLCRYTLATPAALAHAQWPALVEAVVGCSLSYGDLTEESYGKRLPLSRMEDDEGGTMEHYADEHLHTFDWVLTLLALPATFTHAQWAELVLLVCKEKAARVSYMSFGDNEMSALLAAPHVRKHPRYLELAAAAKKAFPFKGQ